MSEKILTNPNMSLAQPTKKKRNSKFGLLLSKLSGAFMLPISLLAVAGIFLGVGNAIASHSDAVTFGNFIQQIGNGTFSLLPLLFCISIAIAYTNQAAVAGFAAVVGWVTLNGLQSTLLFPRLGANGAIIDYSIFGWQGAAIYGDISSQLITANQGINSFNTSVFGAILVGALVAWIYNRFSTAELPMVISFFSGKRLAPIMTVFFMAPLTFVFVFIWPLVGKALQEIGNGLNSAPGSLNALVFGFIERSLIPFGLHHVFYAPLWWTSAGGSLTPDLFANAITGGLYKTANEINNAISNKSLTNNNIISEWNIFMNLWNGKDPTGKFDITLQRPFGDAYIWFFMQKMPSDIFYMQNGDPSNVLHESAFAFTSDKLGVDVGQYMQGKYNFMIFGLPAAAAAIVMAAPRENRKMAASVAFSAVASSFISGITEPIEFTFLFLAPWLYWGVHASLAAISFWLMALMGAHIGMTFSGGTIDFIVYGLIPWSHGTNAWLVFIMGPIYAVVYFFLFWFLIKRFDIETPGRGTNTQFFTKKDYLAKKAGLVGATGGGAQLSVANQYVVAGLGGWSNISGYNSCATRLRYDINDYSKVDELLLRKGGAHGVMKMGEHAIQVIMGPRAEIVNTQISESIGAPITIDTTGKTVTGLTQEFVQTKEKLAQPIKVKAVAVGELKSITKVNDKTFAEKMLGDGIVIKPKKGEIFAPFDGKISALLPHAWGIESKSGVQILIHAGIDTVNLKGNGFSSTVKQGDEVKTGQLLGSMDLKIVQEAGYSTDIVVILLNESKGSIKIDRVTGDVTKSSIIFEVH